MRLLFWIPDRRGDAEFVHVNSVLCHPKKKITIVNNEPTDLITLLIALIAVLTGREIAQLVGPYAAIIVLACAGAGVALSKADHEMSNFQAGKYVSLRVLMAVCFTIAVAEFLQNYVPGIKPRYSLVPIAFLIGWVKDYNSIASWIGERISVVVKRKTDE